MARRKGRKALTEPERKQVKKIVKQAIKSDAELKQFVRDITTGLISTTAGTKHLFQGLIQGVGDSQRIGSKYKIWGIECRFSIQLNATFQSDIIRAIILVDKQANGVTFVSNDLITDNGAGLGVNAPRTNQLKNNFRVLYDRTMTVQKKTGAASGTITNNAVPTINTFSQVTPLELVKSFKFIKRFKQPIITYYYPNANAGTVADIETNSIYLGVWSQNGTTSMINGKTSILYTDE